MNERTPVLPGFEGYAGRNVALGAWDTHPEVAETFVRWARVGPGDRVLEPSAGIGNLVRALAARRAIVTAVEIDPAREEVLRRDGHAGRVIGGDFLSDLALDRHDLALLNPPYEKDGETRHLLRALEFAPRACMIMRLVGLASERRAAAWRSVRVTRLAVLVPRPVFAGSSGMDEVCFVEAMPARENDDGLTALEWLDWRAVQGSTP